MLNVRKLALTFILMLILCSTLLLTASYPTQAKTEYSIEVNGYTWDHPTISVSIFPRENESWWEPSYLNATLHAIEQWNDAIQEFAYNYPNFSYISKVHLVPTVSHKVVSGFNIYVIWKAECQSEAMIGHSQAKIQSPCIIINNTVNIGAKAPSGHVMTEVDMQNIVVHEIGHTFGLSHSNYSGDVM